MAVELLSPGTHTFRAGEGILSYHVTPSKKENSRLWVQQAIAWGPGRNLYVKTLAPLLSEHFTVLDFSPRGSDESTRPKDAAGNDDPSQMSCTAMLDDLEALRQHLGLEAFGILSGHSQAGIPVLLYAALYPTRVQNLVAIGSGMLNFDQSQSFEHYRKIRSPLPPWKKSYEAWTQFQQTPPKTDEELREVLIEIMPSNLVNPDRDRCVWNCSSR
ncbi:hypothetical protein PRZ48_013329 [Zasmidium cellare]|uniref:AB hydrolase-1 domain-containing protein n=1 Tax=Zasmidium cellare TaxID=395010 RepID=A0ABR0E0R9_ZASCE|nr:hypothetical protein PRZ48_013329 [Zasmidium cellare]